MFGFQLGVPFSLATARTIRVVVCAIAFAASSGMSFGAEHRVSVLLDVDNAVATGCTVATADGAVNGIERIQTAVIITTTTTASISRLEQQTCAGGVLSAATTYDAGGWSAGVGNGGGGAAAIEFSVPLSTLPRGATMKAYATSRNALGQQDATGSFLITLANAIVAIPESIPVPLSKGLAPLIALAVAITVGLRLRHQSCSRLVTVLIAGVVVSALAWAGTVLRDGNIGDWAGVAPAVTDPRGDAPANADIVTVFQQQDASNLYFRVDTDIKPETPVNTAPIVNAGANQTLTLPATASLAGSATDDGLPNPPATLTYAWTKVSGPGTVTFASATSAATSATFSVAGSYVLRLTASDSALTGRSDVTISVNAAIPGNLAPVVNAGANQTIISPASASLAGSATDDGLPNPPAALTYAWTKVSGPGTVTFANATSAATSATFSVIGSYVLRLTASDSALTGSAEVTIAVNTPANTAPVVSAGSNQAVTLPTVVTLAGTATDDGLPAPSTLTATWSLVSGPVLGVTFGNVNALNSTVTLPLPGVYVLRLSVTDGVLTTTSTVQITATDGAPKLKAIADRTIPVGVRFQQVLAANDGNALDTLTFSLTAAPTGATLNPAPVVDWTPTNAQLGVNTFAARVTDAGGRTDNGTFKITVVAQNRAPVLAALADASVARGVTFTRTLSATDPDGDAVTYSLVTGPVGMTLSGATLSWATASAAPGDFAVTVKASDPAGLFDAKRFTIKVTPSAAPVAQDDSYSIQVGQTLTVPAAQGVLANDVDPAGGTLTASKLSNPTKGAVSAFNSDGSFTYVAPTVVGTTFNPVLKTDQIVADNSSVDNWQLVDVNGDGYPDLIYLDSVVPGFQGTLRAWDIKNNVSLWSTDASDGNCRLNFGNIQTAHMSVADIDDDGVPDVVVGGSCDIPFGTFNDKSQLIAINARTGAFKWKSAPILDTGFEAFATSEWPPFTQYSAPLNVVRLRAGEKPSVVIGVAATGVATRDYGLPTQSTRPKCSAIVATVPDGYFVPTASEVPPHYYTCVGVIVVDGATGAVTQRMIRDVGPYGNPYNYPGNARLGSVAGVLVGDFTGAGENKFNYLGAVWNLDGTRFGTSFPTDIQSIALGNFDDSPDVEMVYVENRQDLGLNRLVVKKHDGRELWSLPLPAQGTGKITVADLDGDGYPDIVFGIELGAVSEVWAVDHRGRVKWIHSIPNSDVQDYVRGTREGRIAVFDLDGDGLPEVIFNVYSELRFLNGVDGTIKGSAPTLSLGRNWYTVARVIDIDNDGHADVVTFSAGTRSRCCGYGIGGPEALSHLRVYSDAANGWRPARKIDHQWAYFGNNINENGTVPTTVPLPNNFATPATNVFGTQAQIAAPVDPRTAQQASFTYAANNGALTSAPATVKIDILPTNRPPKFVSPLVTRFPRTGRDSPPFTFTVRAVDPDVGDTLTYAISTAVGSVACTVGASTGAVNCTAMLDGPIMLIFKATDSFGAVAYQQHLMTEAAGTTTVPNVTTLTLAAADAALATSLLVKGDVVEAFSTAPIGQVVSQFPAAGTSVLQGELVEVTVSKGRAPVIVPFVVGDIQSVASSKLAAAQFPATVLRAYSSTIARGVVMAQSPAAGVLQVPGTSTITVSLGSGLVVNLSQDVAPAGKAVSVSVVRTGLDGVDAPYTGAALSLASIRYAPTGTAPTVSGTTFNSSSDSRGQFRVTASDSAAGISAFAELVVVAPESVETNIDSTALAAFAETMTRVRTLLGAAQIAGNAGDLPTVKARVIEAVTTWRAMPQFVLRRSSPSALELGFSFTAADLLAAGESASTEDVVNLKAWESSTIALSALVDALREPATAVSVVRARLADLSAAAATLSAMTPGKFGLVSAQPEQSAVITTLIPDAMDALMNDLGRTVGLPVVAVQGAAGLVDSGKSTLGDLLVTIAVKEIVDQIDVFNKLRGDAISQAKQGGALLLLAGQLRASLHAKDLVEVVSGASLSFRVFKAPGAFIEGFGFDLKYPYLNDMVFIGPEAVAGVVDISGLLLNIKNAKSLWEGVLNLYKLEDKLKGFKGAADDVYKNGLQKTATADNRCIFTTDPACGQLIMRDGGVFPVYSYASPVGSGVSGIPVPIIVMVRSGLTGDFSIATPPFIPYDK